MLKFMKCKPSDERLWEASIISYKWKILWVILNVDPTYGTFELLSTRAISTSHEPPCFFWLYI